VRGGTTRAHAIWFQASPDIRAAAAGFPGAGRAVPSGAETRTMMQVARELDVDVAPARLWSVLWDVPRMVGCLPGCSDAREVEAHRRYEARMNQRVGPISLSVPMEVTITDAVEPSRLALAAKGRDRLLGATVSMAVTLAVTPRDGGSRLHIEAEGKILGKLGALGQGVIQRKAEELIDEFGLRLRRVATA
jgi:carbon monoxide dehydrogenase subunit G